MSDRGPTRLTLEVEEVDPLAGRLLDSRGKGRRFSGWLGLAAALGKELPDEAGVERNAALDASGSRRRAAGAASAVVLAIEALGAVLMWGPIPLAWLWLGGRVYRLTGSLAADGFVAFFGFVATVLLLVAVLRRVDAVWIGLRRRAGHDQEGGALSEVVAISGALGIACFFAWYYLFSHAYVLPFMPSSG